MEKIQETNPETVKKLKELISDEQDDSQNSDWWLKVYLEFVKFD